MTVESNYMIAIATLSNWLKRLASVFQQMRRKSKTNRTMYAWFFPRFERVTGNCYEFWLVHGAVCSCYDWSKWILWFWFFDSHENRSIEFDWFNPSTLKRTSAHFIETSVINQILHSPKESNSIKLFHSWVQTVFKLISVCLRIWRSFRNFAEHPKTLKKFKRQPKLLKTDFHDVSKYWHLLFQRCLSRFCEQVHFTYTHNGNVGI